MDLQVTGMEGYRELRERAAWLDLSSRGKIAARGEDRARLLHAMTTNHVQQLTPGAGCYAFFLNAQGRILADANLLCRDEDFLLDTEPEIREFLLAHLDHYIIADDVTLEDITAELTTIGVEGPRADELAAALRLPVPEAAGAFSQSGEAMIARLSSTGEPGFRIIAPAWHKETLIAELEAAGAARADAGAARVVRIENGVPRYGEEITDGQIPQETRQMHAVHFSKGCYIGQEIVERVRSRGHVNRLLARLEIETDAVPQRGAKIEMEGKEIGEIVSAAYSPALGKTVGFAYVRAERAKPGAEVVAAGAPAKIAIV